MYLQNYELFLFYANLFFLLIFVHLLVIMFH